MYTLITSAKDSDDLSFGFDRSRDRRKQEVINDKNVKGKYYIRIMLKDIFEFAEHQEKATYGLGYKLTLTRNKDDTVLDKLRLLQMLEIKLITSTGTYLITNLLFNNKVICLNGF